MSQNPLRLLFRPAIAFAMLAFAISGALARPSMVVDVDSGRVLEHHQAFDIWEPASITKLMTALVAFREIESGRLTLKSPVRVSYRAARQPPSHMAYPVGTIVTLDNALKMMLVKSANDIAVAIAEAVSGDVETFADRMNEEAKRIGMTDSHFVNPNGLHAKDHYSTARDLAVLALAIRRQFPQYGHYFSTEALKGGDHVYKGYNLLIGRFRGADGMKTGYVCEAGFNLVGSATRNGHTLVAVVLGTMSSKERAERAADLLEAGFQQIGDGKDYPLLDDLDPPADRVSTVANVSKTVCSEEAGKERWADRGLDHFDTPNLTPLTRELDTVPIAIGGAVGSSKSAVMLLGHYFKEIPMPEKRPVTLSDEVAEARSMGDGPGSETPLPRKRPDDGT